MGDLNPFLRQRLADLDRAGLRRDLRALESVAAVRVVTAHGPLLNFSANDYLGLAHHPAVLEAAAQAVRRWGAGATAARLVCGSLQVFHDLEGELADFKRTEAALLFSSGYTTALGTIPALVGPGDFVLLDRLAHACLVDAAKLSGARLRVFRHNDAEDLDRLLGWVREQKALRPPPEGRGQALIVTESVFSMDGDLAPLRSLVEMKERHDAWLLVDEAHATGVFGPDRSGCLAAQGLGSRVEVALGTLGKALGAAGGFIAGSHPLCTWLVHRARSFVFSTAPVPSSAAAARAALAIVRSPEGEALAGRLWEHSRALHAGLREDGWSLPPSPSPILPLLVGGEGDAVRLAAGLRDEGLLVPAIRHPTVARGQARLRVTVSAAHEAEHLDRLRCALRRARDRTGVRPT